MLKASSQRGFYLLEAIVVMSIAISLMSLGARTITDSAERSVNQVAAQQLKQVTRAAQQYVQDHYQAFNDNPNNRLEWQTLVDQGYLSDKMPKHNHYGQAYQFEVKSANRQLQLILTTQKGQPISESSLRQIAALAGSSAGYATTLHKNKIVGNQEGWFLEGFPLTTGHLASLSIVNEKEIMDAANFLRRTKFKDHEEYNQMETDLLMGENTIQLVKNNKTVQLNTDGVVFSDNKRKSISIFNSYYPHITIQDDTLTTPNTMWLNSADLKFEKGEHTIHIGVDEPGLLISNQNEDTSTKITPANIRLSDRFGKRSSVTNQSISVDDFRSKTEIYSGVVTTRMIPNIETQEINSFTMSGNRLQSSPYNNSYLGQAKIHDRRGLFSELTNHYIKIPSIIIDYGQSGGGWMEDTLLICGPPDREGAMFLLGEKGSLHRRLIICLHGRGRWITSFEGLGR